MKRRVCSNASASKASGFCSGALAGRVCHFIKFSRGQQFGGVVALVEGVCLLDPLYQLCWHGRAGLVVLCIVLEDCWASSPMFVELRRKLHEVVCRCGA